MVSRFSLEIWVLKCYDVYSTCIRTKIVFLEETRLTIFGYDRYVKVQPEPG